MGFEVVILGLSPGSNPRLRLANASGVISKWVTIEF